MEEIMDVLTLAKNQKILVADLTPEGFNPGKFT